VADRLDGCRTDANETNRYLLYVGPGVYNVTAPIQLKAWVTLRGAGEQATLLSGAVSADNYIDGAMIWGENNASVSDLSVENTGGSFNTGICNDHSATTLNNVTVTTSGGNNNMGIYNYHSSSALYNVTVMASGTSGTNYGINNASSSSATLTNVKVTVSGGSSANYGIYNTNSSPNYGYYG